MLDYKLYTFITLCKTLNYRVAAEELNMTQPAVTNHIKQLERAYNCKLFSYESRILRKTKEAEILEKYVLSADYTTKKLKRELAVKKKPLVRIGATKTIGEYIALRQVERLIKNQDVEVFFCIENTNNLLKMLKEGELDFALIEGFFNKEDFAYSHYRTEKLVGICQKNHKFSGRYIDFDELFEERIILREEGSGTGEAFLKVLENKNYTLDKFDTKITANTFGAITNFVKTGLGISFVYESVANSSSTLAKFYVTDVNIAHEFTCVHLKNTKKPHFIEYFARFNRMQ